MGRYVNEKTNNLIQLINPQLKPMAIKVKQIAHMFFW